MPIWVMVIKNRLPELWRLIFFDPASDSEFRLTEPQPPSQPPNERIFNAPSVAVLVATSILILHQAQDWVEASDPYLIAMFAFQPSSLVRGEAWPGVLTSMFLHAGWTHAAMNALGAIAFGPPVARPMKGAAGTLGFLLFYLACGVIATLGYGLLHLDSDGLLVGASGAVFGLTGAALRLLGRRSGLLRPLTDRRFLVPASVLMAVNALIGVIGLAPGMGSVQVAWEAHAFGFVAGALLIGPWVGIFGNQAKRFDSTADLRDGSV